MAQCIRDFLVIVGYTSLLFTFTFYIYLAIKHIHNLPPHLSYVSTLPDITQNRNTAVSS